MVTATIYSFYYDEVRNLIWVNIEYDIDGDIEYTPYPFNKASMVGLPLDQFQEWLRINILYQCNKYIEVEFKTKNKSINCISDSDYYINEYNKIYSGENHPNW
jgi:hypothetical protein